MSNVIFSDKFKQSVSLCLGNLIEHYDTALYGLLAPFLAPQFFPGDDPLTALILTYALIPIGMLSRPLGAWYFGEIADRRGLASALRFSLLGLGCVSVAMACIPTYHQVGFLAPLLLSFLRLLQNFLAAGETMGGGQLLMEGFPEEKKDLASSIFNASTIAGLMLASMAVYQGANAWRWLYLYGAVFSLIAFTLRSQKTYKSKGLRPPLLKELWDNRTGVLSVMIGSGFGYASYIIALVLMNGFVPLVSDISNSQMVKINTYLLLLDGLLLPIFGWLAFKVSRYRVMMAATLGVLIFAGPLAVSLEGGSLLWVVGVRAMFVIFGVLFFAPFHAWTYDILPNSRLISLSYAMGTQIFGGPTAFISLYCFQATGYLFSVVWYWMALALVTTVVLNAQLSEKRLIFNRQL